MPGSVWIDLLDPSKEEIEARVPVPLLAPTVEELSAPLRSDRLPRPVLERHGAYSFGRLLIPVAVLRENRVFFQEIDLVLGTGFVMTVRKKGRSDPPYDISRLGLAKDATPSVVATAIVDDIGERFLDLVDAIDAEIDELEDGIETWPAHRVRRRIAELRHEILRIRTIFAPTRDAVRRVVDNRVAVDGDEDALELRVRFGDAYDKLLRALEGLDVSRELLANARDYHQAKVAETQNDVVKKLTVVASLLLLPTLIVGVYGQNFEHMPELAWRFGYAWSWALIALTTAIQLAFFRWRRWI